MANLAVEGVMPLDSDTRIDRGERLTTEASLHDRTGVAADEIGLAEYLRLGSPLGGFQQLDAPQSETRSS